MSHGFGIAYDCDSFGFCFSVTVQRVLRAKNENYDSLASASPVSFRALFARGCPKLEIQKNVFYSNFVRGYVPAEIKVLLSNVIFNYDYDFC